ncbi:MAG: prolyl-tRNA synthetase, partial [Deferribacteres bacterium]|nr:prolyl-tRNA synthetase [Deferribacteres bacterium]
KGIEVGHIFKLGTKYSEAMNCVFLDKDGKAKPMIMGCYGIGIGRTAAAAIEQNHDEKGIIWPVQLAPFEVVVVPLNTNDEDVIKTADNIYTRLLNKGVDVCIDDRNERAGVKFNDADLIGYPVRVNVGKKALADGCVEIHIRKSGEQINVLIDDACDKIINIIEGLKQ